MSASPNMDMLRLEALERRRIEAGNLVKSRKRKLGELYTVSNLSRIREINDEASLRPVKDSLMSFLEKNDLQNGHLFDIITLQRPNEVGKAETESQTIEDQVSQNPIQNAQPQPKAQPQQILQPSSQTQEHNLQHQPQPQPQIKQQQVQQPQQHSPEQPQPSKQVSVEAPTQPTVEVQTPAVKSTNIEVEHTPSQTLEKPLPKESEPEEQKSSQQQQPEHTIRRPTIKKRKVLEDRVSLYNPDNKEAIDTHVLFLKEQLPAKIAEATPLAELYYLAQTLPLVKLMPCTHKVVTSTMFETALTEGKINVVHSRIEELKRQGKWSLRQPTRFVDPIHGKIRTHWDNLLSEMNWMAIDFREERKLKIATCAYIAQSISDYWNYGKVCCVKRKPIKLLENPVDEPKEMELLDLENATDDLEIDSKENSIDISRLLKRPDPLSEFSPPELPTTTPDEFEERSSPSPFKVSINYDSISDQNKTLLEEMPAFSTFTQFDDKYDSAPLVPVSKALIPIEDDTWYNVLFKQIVDDSSTIPPQQKGLFGFSSQKRINTSIKPPPPPSLKYLDLRTPTIWLPEDDQNLIEYVNQFSFNWGVVSAYLSKKPTRSYSSNIERRTPWQCFERYIQLNDTFQINDMRGQNTLSAMKWLEHAHNIQATTKRRISPLGVGVDSIQRGHKRLRWASMFEAIRKCMRKRESVTRPNNTQVRKNGDDKKLIAPTPAELSKLKYDRDKAIQEAYMQNSANGFRGRVPAPALPGPSSSGTGSGGNHAPNGGPNSGLSSAGGAGAPVSAPRSASQSQAQSQNQQQQAQQRFSEVNKRPNSVPVGQPQQRPSTTPVNVPAGGIGVNANSAAVLPNGQQQQRVVAQGNAIPKVTGPNGTPYTPEQLQQLMQLRQRKLLQQQAQQQAAVQQGNSLPQSSTSPNNLGNAQLINTSLNSNNNIRSNSNPPISGTSSPLIGQPQPVNSSSSTSNSSSNINNNGNNNGRKLTFVPAHVSAIINQIQSQNPNMSKQEVTKIAAQYLANLQAKQHRANTLNGNNSGAIVGGSAPVPPVQNSQNRAHSTQASPSGMPQAKLSTGVPTPQQILQQQGVSSSPTLQSPRVQPQQPVRIQQQSPTVSSPQIPLQQLNPSGNPSPSLTPQQKAQLDMLKALHAEQQQKRQQQQQQQGGGQQFQQYQQQSPLQPHQIAQQSPHEQQLAVNSNIQVPMQNNTPNKPNSSKSMQSK